MNMLRSLTQAATAAWSTAILLALLVVPQSVRAQGSLGDYRRAATIDERFDGLVVGVVQGDVDWVEGTDQAVYRVSVRDGNRFVLVDADQWAKRPAFDHAGVADALSSATGERYTEITLPFNSIEMVQGGQAFEANVEDSRYRCAVSGDSCTRIGDATPEFGGRFGGGPPDSDDSDEAFDETVVASPDCRRVAFIQNHNVATRAPRPGSCVQRDGESRILAPEDGFGGRGGRGGPPTPDHTMLSTDGSEGDAYQLNSIVWSPDARKLVAYRQVPGYERVPHYIQSSPPDQVQPKLVSYGDAPGSFGGGIYRKPGDRLDHNQPVIFDVESKKRLVIDDALFENPYSISRPVWREDGRAYTFQYNQRGHMIYRVLEVDATTGAVRPMVDEVTRSFFMYSDNGKNYAFDVGSACRLGQGGGCDHYTGGELIWASERDGWNHLYLYDARTGHVKNQITRGDWLVRGVDSVDVANRQIYFRASGINEGQDPYFIHYYRIDFDGSDLVAFTEADGTHDVSWSPDHRYYVDSYSRVDLPTVVELKRVSDGQTLALEKGDMSAAVAAGFRPPEVFVSKGRDGVTDIWGIIVRPVQFDPNVAYPVVEQIYAGPHGSFVPKSWGGGQRLMPMAEIGFVMVQIDGMGTANRSKAFHDVAWKNIADGGFPDRILWHKAADAKYPWYDSSRVGIYGTSAGGQNAAGAVFFHPEFYDAAMANSGCHDNRMDKIWWNEAWMGEMGPHYEANSNVTAAKNLRGKLFLTVGEMDTNVDPSSTYQVVDALIKAGKDFDFLMVPNGGHGATGPDGTRRRYDFFVESLWGIDPPDWNAGTTISTEDEPSDLELPADPQPVPGFFEQDPKLVYPSYWF